MVKTLSPSSINTYKRCPRSFYYSYILRLPEKPNVYTEKGRAVHAALEEFFTTYTPGMNKRMLSLFDKYWKPDTLEMSDEEKKQHYEDGKHMLTFFVSTFKEKIKSLLLSGKAENERHAFYVLRPKFREIKIKDKILGVNGIIDRINIDFNNTITLGDYKTGSKYGIGLDEDIRRQVAIYALLYKNKENKIPDFVAVDFLRYGETYFIEVTPSLLTFASQEISSVKNLTKSEDIADYPLKEGKLCKYCNFFDKCFTGSKEKQKNLNEIFGV